MSESKKKKQDQAEAPQKVVTRYDLRMQRRAEQKRKAQMEKRIYSVIGILLLAGLVCFIASFPIRSYLTVNGTYIVVDGEKVTKVEFDYNFNMVLNNYANSETGMYLSYFGIDLSGNLSAQMYSDTLTWQDYFEQQAVENIKRSKALTKEMEAAGFSYDVTEDYEDYLRTLELAAEQSGMSVDEYITQLYGPYATKSRIEKLIKAGLKTSAYYETLVEANMPSDAEVLAYYEENRDSYDMIDYRVLTVEAELPTEPTELADPVEEDADGETADGEKTTDTETADGTEEAYVPSEAEVQAAMDLAREQAEGLLETVAQDGELVEGAELTTLSSLLSEWLFDSARTEGDTTVIEDAAYDRYYVLAFEQRYQDPSPTVDVRVIITEDGNGQAILDEWKAGVATEESFGDLADQYNDPLMIGADGGLFEGMVTSGAGEEVDQWLYDTARTHGDTTVISPEGDTMSYVIYFVGPNEPYWKLEIQSILLEDIMAEYEAALIADIEVEDPHHYLYYLQLQQIQDSAAQGGSDESSSDESGNDSGSGAVENSSAE